MAGSTGRNRDPEVRDPGPDRGELLRLRLQAHRRRDAGTVSHHLPTIPSRI